MLTVIAGLFAAVFYAFNDMLQQHVSRSIGVLRVMCWALPTGVGILVPVALITDGLPVTSAQWRAVVYCVIAGSAYLGAWLSGLRALRTGDLSVVAPLFSLQGLLVAAFAIAKGEDLTVLLGLGIGLAIIGGTLAGVQGRAKSAAGAGWALLSSTFWGMSVVCYDRAQELSWLSQAAWSRASCLVLFVPIAVVVLGRQGRVRAVPTPELRRATGRKDRVICMSAGIVGVVALSATTLAVQRGPLAVAAVTIAQYATVAVVFGFFLLRERPRPHQVVGVFCTLAAVTILSAVG